MERRELLIGHHDENDNTKLSLGPLNNTSVMIKGNLGTKMAPLIREKLVMRKTENSINDVQLKFLKNQHFSIYSQLKPEDREFQVLS